MNVPVVQINGLGVGFGQQQVLSDISLTIARGAAIGLSGESGSGKTMLALAILGLLPPPARILAGDIRVQGDSLLQLNSAQLRGLRGGRVAMVFQEPMTSLNPVFAVGCQIGELLSLHRGLSRRSAKRTAEELLEQVGIDDAGARLSAYPHELSGGQKQRVMIAMALACQPDLLIADEPTTALDVTVQQQVLQVLKEVRQQYKMSLLFVTHDLGVMAQMVDEIAVLHQGRMREYADTRRLFRQPQDPYTQALIACRPRLGDRRERLPTLADFTQPQPSAPATTTSTTMAAGDRLVSIQSLDVWFRRRDGLRRGQYLRAVNQVDLDIRRGTTMALVGESGSGKTSLARALLRLVQTKSGQVHFDGNDVLAARQRALRVLRRRMQVVFQDPFGSLNPRMTVAQALCEPMRVHRLVPRRQQRTRAAELLTQVALDPAFLDRYPHQFSGGQRQRFGIARALAVQPEFIVCDECVSSLDVSVQAQVLNILKHLQRTLGLTYLFISHDLAVVSFIADDIAVMKGGKVVEQGPAEAVLRQPQHRYTQTLLAAVPADPVESFDE